MTIRRMKTYTGGQGYVYQYYFVGQRPASSGTEYIFDVTSDRKTMFSVTVSLDMQVLQAWAARHGRSLSDAEQYAAVKLRLFQAFDEVEDMRADGRNLTLDDSSLQNSLATLGVE
jgi:hypothetical protein